MKRFVGKMGKDKTKTGVPNKHLHARISFLQQAATYLTLQTKPKLDSEKDASLESGASEPLENLTGIDGALHETSTPKATQSCNTKPYPSAPLASETTPKPCHSLHLPPIPDPSSSARLTSHLALIAQKSQIRLTSNIKHQICKRCSTILIEGSTCRKFIENLSRGGRKAHADVLVVECGVCGGRKRWAVGVGRQGKGKGKKGERRAAVGESGKGCEHKKDGKVCGTNGEGGLDVGAEEDT